MKVKLKVGDQIKIVNPEFYIRHGYELTQSKVVEEFTPEQLNKISELCNYFGIKSNNDKLINRVKYAVAYGIVKTRGFGGWGAKYKIVSSNVEKI